MTEDHKSGESSRSGQQISAPSLSLPKGGGAIRGIGEKFAANPVTGTGSMSIPIAVSPGRNGFGPELGLSYDSGAGNGPFGLGWNLSLPSITRKTDKGLPKYQDAEESDVFILSGAEDLVPVLVEKNGEWQPEQVLPRTMDGKEYEITRYRPRIEGLFARIERWTNRTDPADVFWRSISKDNITTWYGKTDKSRIADPTDKTHIFSWLIYESYDDKGNAIIYKYEQENSKGVELSNINEKNRTRGGNRYLKRIKYGNRSPNRDADWNATDPSNIAESDWMFKVVFDYGEHDPDVPTPDDRGEWLCRRDSFSSHRAGFEVRTYRLCRRVLMFHHFSDELKIKDYLVRSTDFTYQEGPIASFISAVTQSGYVYQGQNNPYLKKSLPPVEFEYSQAEIQQKIEEIDSDSLENLPYGLDGANYQWVDLDGEGLSGILTEQGGGWWYKRNLSANNQKLANGEEFTEARFAPLELVATKPAATLAGGQAQFMDLAGDGQLDLVSFNGPVRGFYERTDAAGWKPFRPFVSWPNLDTRDPNLKFVDLNGDSHADMFIAENEVFTWYPSLAEDGFAPVEKVNQPIDEEQGPRLIFADGTESVYLADLSGDGLTDVARIRNGEVCYWPNLGYGRFGAKVTMDNAPWFDAPDQFDQKRIRLADIDSSGTTDILYLGHDSIAIYRNQSGNSWSEPEYFTNFPRVDNLAAVQVVDLLGNGTACLVWSSPLPGKGHAPMRYIKLIGEHKPHLLIKTVNNLGAETHVQYAPSTKFYLADKEAGKPWITKIPFPVHVVERVETYDRISRNRFVTRYAYHHGYFDGEDREFRGFGMVEQWDTEEFATLNSTGQLSEAVNIDAASHVPPVLTRTWFHTGAYRQGAKISGQFEREYYREDDPSENIKGLEEKAFQAMLLEDTVLPDDLPSAEIREACLALKGSVLRQEVYACDEGDEADRPYTVSEQNYTVKRLQAQDTNKHAVFFVHARESLNFHYERKLIEVNGKKVADPRISHSMTLKVDDYGNVERAVAIGYGRRPGHSPLENDEDRKKQEQLLITYTENDVTNAITNEPDDYRAPLPCETRTYELSGFTLGNQRFCFEDFSEKQTFASLDAAEGIPYESAPDSTKPQKRLIEHARTLYRHNDLTGPLPLGEAQSLALPFESYTLAFTPGLLDVYTSKIALPALQNVLRDDGKYVNLDDTNWWIPSGKVFYSSNKSDPTDELAEAQAHFFLPRRFQDPFGQSSKVTYDANNLLMLETCDALGNVVSAKNDYRVLQPKITTDPNGNRSQVAFDTLGMVVAMAVMGKENETEPEKIGDTLDDPTTRLEYDLFNWMNTRQPNYVRTLAREKHRDPSTRWQESYSYSDGFGREIQKKIQAEPEKPGAPLRWVGSGWTIFNNKGKPIRQYEPFFSTLPPHQRNHFEFARIEGVSPVLFYDPLGRVIATLHPNHAYEKVVFDPWQQISYDVNDTVKGDPRTDSDIQGYVEKYFESQPPNWKTWLQARIDPQNPPTTLSAEQAAAVKTLKHADTPTVAHSDSLGRSFLSIADNGLDEDGKKQEYETRIVFDIEGNQREVIDAKGRIVMQYDYYMAGPEEDEEDEEEGGGNLIHQASMEGGERWMLNDVAGNPIRAWDSRDHQFKTEYDALRRPIYSFVKGFDPESPQREILFEKTEYGETQPSPEVHNLRGQIFRLCDQAGVVTNAAYDFKGNPLQGSRQLAVDYKRAVDWSDSVPLEGEKFISRTAYDALNRPIQTIAPHSDTPGSNINIIQPVYNEANLLEEVHAWLNQSSEPNDILKPDSANLHTVKNIDYDAKGQRTLIEYGNGVKTQYEYDPETFRLINLYTTRGNQQTPECQPQLEARTCEDPPNICTKLQNNRCVLQNLHYTYDPVGNITHIRDDAQQIIYFRNKRVEPSADYVYDAIYRLIKGTGREHLGQNASGQLNPPQQITHNHDDSFRKNRLHPGDGRAMGNYTETYEYDEVGNFDKVVHKADNGNWTRHYAYKEESLLEPGRNIYNNRLSATSIPGDDPDGPYSHTYSYIDAQGNDVHGCMTSMPHLPVMQWDFDDQLQVVDLQGGGKAYYAYDAGGQRVRKVREHNGSTKEERIYLGGFEIYRRSKGNPSTSSGQATSTGSEQAIELERETLRIMDDEQRIALIETRTQGTDGSPEELIRYQFGNHLGSTSLELNEKAQSISYEEYYPYGSTSYQAVNKSTKTAAKRYRYTGKERDEESGLNYHGARYYAPWLGTWTNCDPIGIKSSFTLYSYVQNNPIIRIDPDGREDVFSIGWGMLKRRLSLELIGITKENVYVDIAKNKVDYTRKSSGFSFWSELMKLPWSTAIDLTTKRENFLKIKLSTLKKENFLKIKLSTLRKFSEVAIQEWTATPQQWSAIDKNWTAIFKEIKIGHPIETERHLILNEISKRRLILKKIKGLHTISKVSAATSYIGIAGSAYAYMRAEERSRKNLDAPIGGLGTQIRYRDIVEQARDLGCQYCQDRGLAVISPLIEFLIGIPAEDMVNKDYSRKYVEQHIRSGSAHKTEMKIFAAPPR